MDLGLWGSLWANCALGATILTLPSAQLVQNGANANFGSAFLPQAFQINAPVNADETDCSSEDEEEDGPEDIARNGKEEDDDENEDDDDEESQNAFLDQNVQTELEQNESSECAQTMLLEDNDQSSNDSDSKGNQEDENCKNQTGKKKKFNNKTNLQRIRYSREEYRCTLCPYTCTTEKAFFKHLRTCESKDKSLRTDATIDEPRLSCPVCGKDRSGEQSLAIHMRRHKDNKYFCCDICIFRTVQLKKLIQHRRMHTGERPHLCPHCTYRSARRDNLRSHVRRVHKKENLTCDTFSPRGMLLAPSCSK